MKKIMTGDYISANGRTFMVNGILFQDYYGDRDQAGTSDCWGYDIEFTDLDGNYHHWKQNQDGGVVTFVGSRKKWMISTVVWYGSEKRTLIDMPGMLPVSFYKDITGQYTDEECDLDNVVEIPVPEDLLLQWFRKEWHIDDSFDRYSQEFGYTESDVKDDLKTWVYQESTCDDTIELFQWLEDHGYTWKRID